MFFSLGLQKCIFKARAVLNVLLLYISHLYGFSQVPVHKCTIRVISLSERVSKCTFKGVYKQEMLCLMFTFTGFFNSLNLYFLTWEIHENAFPTTFIFKWISLVQVHRHTNKWLWSVNILQYKWPEWVCNCNFKAWKCFAA